VIGLANMAQNYSSRELKICH